MEGADLLPQTICPAPMTADAIQMPAKTYVLVDMRNSKVVNLVAHRVINDCTQVRH